MTESGPAKGGRPRNPDVEKRVAEVTLALLQEITFTQLTMELIAERCGLSKTALYRRWKTKGALVADALAFGIAEPFPIEGDVKECLRQGLVGSYIRGVHRGCSHALASVLGEISMDSDLGVQFRERCLKDREKYSTELFTRGIAEGRLRADIPMARMYHLLGGPLLMASLFNNEMSFEEMDHIFDTAWEAISLTEPAKA